MYEVKGLKIESGCRLMVRLFLVGEAIVSSNLINLVVVRCGRYRNIDRGYTGGGLGDRIGRIV